MAEHLAAPKVEMLVATKVDRLARLMVVKSAEQRAVEKVYLRVEMMVS
jgi:hypothetical protein